MPFILRVDVDKPYGRASFSQKIKSKIAENYFSYRINSLGYLKANQNFLEYCNLNKISGIFYFRNCTQPNEINRKLINLGGHKIGFHAENTRTLETFSKELQLFENSLSDSKVHSFSKHGSGNIKIGKHHYAPYEPEKYKEWSNKLGVSFPFGNEIADSEEDFPLDLSFDFIAKMFWIHEDYRTEKLNTIDQIIEIAKEKVVPIIIHPSNFRKGSKVYESFCDLIEKSKEHQIDWLIP